MDFKGFAFAIIFLIWYTINSMEDKISSEERFKAAIGYLWVLCLVPILAKKRTKFLEFHGKQGLALLVAWFILWLFGWIPILGWLALLAGNIVFIILMFFGIVSALQGIYWEMPVLGKYAKKIKI